MTRRVLFLSFSLAAKLPAQALPAPGLHHIHLNSTDPAAAIAFYTRQFPSTSRVTFAGLPALKTNGPYLLFQKVKNPPATLPQTAIWHFGFQVGDLHQGVAAMKQRGVRIVPLFVKNDAGEVVKTEVAEAKPGSPPPTAFAFLAAPDGGIIEYQGDFSSERINHVHMFQHDPYCAELWYHRHLNAPSKSTYTEANCKVPRPGPSWPAFEPQGMLRQPAGVVFDDVSFTWHVQQDETTPLASTRGHLVDHFALSVTDLNAWIAKLRGEGVKFLTKSYKLGDLRAVMIEGPGREAIELVEAPGSAR